MRTSTRSAVISRAYRPICGARFDEGRATRTCLYAFLCLRWSGPKCRNFASSSVLHGHPPVSGYRRVTDGANVSLRDFVQRTRAENAWPNLHTYKAHSMCFRGRKSTQLRESLNPSLSQHPDDACGREARREDRIRYWYNVTLTRRLHGNVRHSPSAYHVRRACTYTYERTYMYTSYIYIYPRIMRINVKSKWISLIWCKMFGEDLRRCREKYLFLTPSRYRARNAAISRKIKGTRSRDCAQCDSTS